MILPLYLCILVSLVAVAWLDFKTQKISNYWSLLNLIIFIGLALGLESFSLSWGHLIYPLLLLIAGFTLFVLKVMGGGDAKYLSTLFLVIPTLLHQQFFELLLLSTCLVGGMLFLINSFRNRERIISAWRISGIGGVRACFGTRFSYAPVILFAWIWLGFELKILS